MTNKRQILEQKLEILQAQHHAAQKQKAQTIDASIRVILDYNMREIEDEIDQISEELDYVLQTEVEFQAIKELEYLNFYLVLSETSDRENFTATFHLENQVVELGCFNKIILTPLYSHLTDLSELATYGAKVHDALNLSIIKDLLNVALLEKNKRPRLIIQASSEILDLHWEWLHDGTEFWAGKYRMIFLRMLPGKVHLDKPLLSQPSPLRVLFTTSYQDSAIPLTTLESISQQWPNQFQIKSHLNITASKLFQCLRQASMNDTPFHIWHHHGTFTPTKDTLCITFNNVEQIDIQHIPQIIGQHPPIGLFILSSPNTNDIKNLTDFIDYIPASTILQMPQPIENQNFLMFLEEFYSVLLFRPIDESLRRAQAMSIRNTSDKTYWSLPRLLINHNS